MVAMRELKIRWAQKISQAKIRQLYQKDAQGIVDEELIDDVGVSLLARSESILLVSTASARCPKCDTLIEIGWGHAEDDIVQCPDEGCTWQAVHRDYHNSWRHQDLIGVRAETAFREFIDRYSRAKGARAKMILIDQLIHAFHQGIRKGMPHRSAANNLIQGSHREVVAFLDGLTYADGSTPGVRESRDQWRVKMKDVDLARNPKGKQST
jgi:hypothetical protein